VAGMLLCCYNCSCVKLYSLPAFVVGDPPLRMCGACRQDWGPVPKSTGGAAKGGIKAFKSRSHAAPKHKSRARAAPKHNNRAAPSLLPASEALLLEPAQLSPPPPLRPIVGSLNALVPPLPSGASLSGLLAPVARSLAGLASPAVIQVNSGADARESPCWRYQVRYMHALLYPTRNDCSSSGEALKLVDRGSRCTYAI
jgi:hypothetical protein